MTRAEFWDADRETVMRAEAVADERRFQFEESLLRAAWWGALWSIGGPPKDGYAEIRSIVRGIPRTPPTPAELREKFEGLAGTRGGVIPLSEVGETLPFARKEVANG